MFDLNALRKQLFSGSLLSDAEVIDTVNTLDRHLDAALEASLLSKPVRTSLASIACRILHGRNRNMKTLHTTATKAERAARGSNFTADEVAFLSAYTTLESGQAVPISSFRLFRRTKVEILAAVSPTASGYMTSVRAAAVAFSRGTSASASDIDTMHAAERAFDLPNAGLCYSMSRTVLSELDKYTEARNHLCGPYLRKVWSVVCNTISQDDGRFLELFNWGVTGLFVAAECFDATRRSSFGRFAENWIHQRVLSYMKQAFNIITQDSSAIQARTAVRTAIRVHGLGHLSVDDLVKTLHERLSMPVHVVMTALAEDRSFSGLVNLGTTIGDEESKTTIGDTVAAVTADEDLDSDTRAILSVASEALDADEFRILCVYLGMEHTAEDGRVLVPTVVDTALRQRAIRG